MDKPRLVVDNAKPEKARRTRRAPMVSPYCPTCNGSTWIHAKQGPADTGGATNVSVRLCAHCLAKGKVTTW